MLFVRNQNGMGDLRSQRKTRPLSAPDAVGFGLARGRRLALGIWEVSAHDRFTFPILCRTSNLERNLSTNLPRGTFPETSFCP
ncbi:hypothetical protein DM02DRAFT_610517 [Periconia macrospinosa]|uniref:Uncharacterized protein n=1 Tax=Periconia macrospinosa TaxID=97972 RepID=A0A2V1E568_9PLEO|nr:hypothetical protein DM02DRAFT_610517 [Periconia macrospinosa]